MKINKEKLIGILESNTIGNLKTVEFQKTSINEYLYRFFSKVPNVAELYQINSVLNEYNVSSIITNEKIKREIKDWYLTTTYKIDNEEIDIEKAQISGFLKNVKDLPWELSVFLVKFINSSGKEKYWLYDVDLLLLYKDKIYRFVPLNEFLFLELKVDSAIVENFIEDWIITEEKNKLNKAVGIIFIVGVPWRNMIFSSVRGYKQMLLTAGELIYYFTTIAQNQNLEILICNDFYDTKINNLLNLDGIESFTISIIAILKKEKQA